MTQIEVENNTPYRRRIFLHPRKLPVNEPIPLMLAAWKHFDLGPGESAGTSLGVFRVGAHVARGSVLDHRTVVADDPYDHIWTFGLTNGIPALTGGDAPPRGQIQVVNGLDGPDAEAVSVTFYRDYAPCDNGDALPHQTIVYSALNVLFAYASKPISGGTSALVMEPVVGTFESLGQDVHLKLSPSADGTTVQWSSVGARTL
jgi:hypothetical protein